ncbi:MAG: uroporphyrinogen-III C-methyltransferase [Gammaproteobacteria bacterium]
MEKPLSTVEEPLPLLAAVEPTPEVPPPQPPDAWGNQAASEERTAVSARPAWAGVNWWPWALLLVYAAGAVTFYKWWRDDYAPAAQTLRSQLEALSERGEASKREFKELSAGLEALRKRDGEVGTLLDSLSREEQALEGSLTELALRKPEGSDRVVLAEAEYLLNVAAQRLALERDLKGALTALELADGRLLSLGRPELSAVRAQLIKDMSELRGVPPVDTSGPALYLSDVIQRVERLPFLGGPITPAADPEPAPEQAVSVRSWSDFGRDLWNDLKGLVTIKEMETRDPLLFDPAYRNLLVQHLRLELSNARLAVLNRDERNLAASVDIVTGVLERYFDQEDPGLASIIAKLKAMRAAKLDAPPPSIDKSIEALRGYVFALTGLPPGAEKKASPAPIRSHGSGTAAPATDAERKTNTSAAPGKPDAAAGPLAKPEVAAGAPTAAPAASKAAPSTATAVPEPAPPGAAPAP